METKTTTVGETTTQSVGVTETQEEHVGIQRKDGSIYCSCPCLPNERICVSMNYLLKEMICSVCRTKINKVIREEEQMKTNLIKCKHCDKEEIFEDFVTSFICVECDRRRTIEEELNRCSFKSVADLSQHDRVPM